MVYANDYIRVTIDDKEVVFSDKRPVIIDGRTLVPVRGVFDGLGFEVEWDRLGGVPSLRSYSLKNGFLCLALSANFCEIFLIYLSYSKICAILFLLFCNLEGVEECHG